MSQQVTIQGLDSVENVDIDLTTPVPFQRANVEKFESMEVGQFKDIIFAKCETAGATAAKVAYLTNYKSCKIRQGTSITVIFDNANTASNITLKIQDQNKTDISGNIAVMALNSALLQLGTGSIKANSRMKFDYDGTYWLAHTEVVEQSSSYTKYADGRTVYTPISSIDTSSSAPVNSSAVNGALADYQPKSTVKKLISKSTTTFDLTSNHGYLFVISHTNSSAYNSFYLVTAEIVIDIVTSSYLTLSITDKVLSIVNKGGSNPQGFLLDLGAYA